MPDEQLQNKKHRYYFSSAILLDRNMVYISPLDLNMENKKIEIPYKPVLRFAVPVLYANGNRHGIVLFNFLAETIRSNLPSLHTDDDKCRNVLLNNEGFWLYCDQDETFPFRFMFPVKEQTTFFERFPAAA